MASRIYLVGNQEISDMLGRISRQRVYQITRRADFPRPVAKLAQGKVWLGEQVEAWIATRRGRRPERPFHPDTSAGTPSATGRPPDPAHRDCPGDPASSSGEGGPSSDAPAGPEGNRQIAPLIDAPSGPGHSEPPD